MRRYDYYDSSQTSDLIVIPIIFIVFLVLALMFILIISKAEVVVNKEDELNGKIVLKDDGQPLKDEVYCCELGHKDRVVYEVYVKSCEGTVNKIYVNKDAYKKLKVGNYFKFDKTCMSLDNLIN